MSNFLNDQNTVSVTPHASVMVFNYLDRVNYQDRQQNSNSEEEDPTSIEDVEVVLLDSHIIDIRTNKPKGSPNGTFTITLAPNINWISRLTVGSWVVIMMASNTDIMQKDYRNANHKLVKFIGQIVDVSQSVSYSETEGKKTRYQINGTEWSGVLNDTLYLSEFLKAPPTGTNELTGALLLMDKELSLKTMIYGNSVAGTITVDNTIEVLLHNYWGSKNTATDKIEGEVSKTIDILKASANAKGSSDLDKALANVTYLIHPIYSYNIPTELMQFMGEYETSLPLMIKKISGKTEEESDSQSSSTSWGTETNKDPMLYRIPTWSALTSNISVWSLINELSEPHLFDIYPEMRWETINEDSSFIKTVEKYSNPLKLASDYFNGVDNSKKKPHFCLVHRPKPFLVDPTFTKKGGSMLSDKTMKAQIPLAGESKLIGEIEDFTSYFTNVKRHTIAPENVISIQLDATWDKFNFAEIVYDQMGATFRHLSVNKFYSQCFDILAFKREGFRPYRISTNLIPRPWISEKLKEKEDSLGKAAIDAAANKLSNINVNINAKVDLNALNPAAGLQSAAGGIAGSISSLADSSKFCSENVASAMTSKLTSFMTKFASLKMSTLSLPNIKLSIPDYGAELKAMGGAAMAQAEGALSDIKGQAGALADKVKGLASCDSAKKDKTMSAEDRKKREGEIDAFFISYTRAFSLILGEWFFNIHKMLSGQVTIYGQDGYIEVGNNICWDVRVFDNSENLSNYKNRSKASSRFGNFGINIDTSGETTGASILHGVKSFLMGPDPYYFMAHIENVAHSYTVSPAGTRSFRTTVSFSRGIIVDSNFKAIMAKDAKGNDRVLYALDNINRKGSYDSNSFGVSVITGDSKTSNDNTLIEYKNDRQDLKDVTDLFKEDGDSGGSSSFLGLPSVPGLGIDTNFSTNGLGDYNKLPKGTA